ncbi:MAG: hypothetical protein KDD82_27835 [Planctomycetes bacterium]|nr:hypothetical protein [Planctomycetota bacterium]
MAVVVELAPELPEGRTFTEPGLAAAAVDARFELPELPHPTTEPINTAIARLRRLTPHLISRGLCLSPLALAAKPLELTPKGRRRPFP